MTWAGFEPRTSRMLSEHDNHYTMSWWNIARWQGLYAESWVNDGMRLVFHGDRIDDMCVCAESLEVEVSIRYQLVVQWLERSLTMPENSGPIPEISDH
jgi:hypothetical protein